MFRNCFLTKELILKYGGVAKQTYQKSVVVRKRPTFESTPKIIPSASPEKRIHTDQNKPKSFEKRMQFRTFNRWVFSNIFHAWCMKWSVEVCWFPGNSLVNPVTYESKAWKLTKSRKKKDKINCIYFCNQLSVGYLTKTGDMTTPVRFTGVPAQGKMNTLFIFHRNGFLLNLIDHAVD